MGNKFNYKASELRDEIIHELKELPLTFENFLRESVPDIITDDFSLQYIIDGMMDHLFEKHNGTVSNSKLNFIKNSKNLSFQLIVQDDFMKTIDLYSKMNEIFFNFLEKVDVPYQTFIENINLNTIEINKLSTFFYSFSSAVTAVSNDIFVIRQLLRSSPSIEQLIDMDINITIPKDKLKKYYFSHTLDLKNNVKIFDVNSMVYGENNNIMRSYKRIIEFVYTDFVYYYNTLYHIILNIKENFNGKNK